MSLEKTVFMGPEEVAALLAASRSRTPWASTNAELCVGSGRPSSQLTGGPGGVLRLPQITAKARRGS